MGIGVALEKHRIVRPMKTMAIGLLVMLLVAALIASLLLIFLSIESQPKDHFSTLAELLLVTVLSAEGLIAIAALWQEAHDARVRTLKELMDANLKELVMDSTLQLYKDIVWGEHYHTIAQEPVVWIRDDHGPSEVAYRTITRATRIVINFDDNIWKRISCVVEYYQMVELLCEHDSRLRNMYLEFQHLPIVRLWGRLDSLIKQEQQRRGSPQFWKFFLALAKCAIDRESKLLRPRGTE